MYEHFTTRARKVMELSEKAARDWSCEFIGTAHILLGLIHDGGDLIVHALKNLGINRYQLQQEIERNIDKAVGKAPAGKIPLSPGAKSLIGYAILEAEKGNDPDVGVEHLLLGLVREKEGVASQILSNFGVGVDDFRNEVLLLVVCDVRSKGVIDCQLIQTSISPPIEGPMPRRWTREEYHRMAQLGIFRDPRVELIEGEVMILAHEQLEHFTLVAHAHDRIGRAFEASSLSVSRGSPLNLGPLSEPTPDLSVVPSRPDYYYDLPTTALLVIEVSYGSLDYDRTRKASLYARAGIVDYWIVNLVDRQLEVHRDPRPDPSQPYGHGYARVTTLIPPAFVHLLAAPQVSLAVAELLP